MSKIKHVFYGYYPSEDAKDVFYRQYGHYHFTDNNLTTFKVTSCSDVRYRITVEKAPLQRKRKRRMK